MHTHKYTKTSKSLPHFYSPTSLQGKLFMLFPHIIIQSSIKQTLILCAVFSIVPTVWEIISFDLLEERTEGEVELSKQVFYSKP